MKKTHANLLKAFAGESIARNKYTFYAKKAREEGYEWIAQVFEETADNERAHAEREYEFIREFAAMKEPYSIYALGTTLENLKAAAAGEHYETEEMYPGFEKVAKAERELQIATIFKEIGEVEEKHEERYLKLAERLENDTLYKTDEVIEWKCLNCGYIHKGKEAPAKCPACGKPQGWYLGMGLIRKK